MTAMFLVCRLLAFALFCGCWSVSALVIYPARALINPHGMIGVSCVSHVPPMTECRFRIRYQYADQAKAADTPVFDFEPVAGFEARRVVQGSTGEKLYDVKARGDPSRPNACVILLEDMREGDYLVACRARDVQGGWIERIMPVHVDYYLGENGRRDVSGDKNMIVDVAYGDANASIDLEMGDGNKFDRPCALVGVQNVTQRGESSLNAARTVCTLPIAADEKARGPLWAAATFTTRAQNVNMWPFVKIINVVGVPKTVTLALSLPLAEGFTAEGWHAFEDGYVMSATCSVHESTHDAAIAWTFGNETLAFNSTGWSMIIKDNINDWTWPWEPKTIEQTISRKLGAADSGKTLKCTARYFDARGEVQETKEAETKLIMQKIVSTSTTTMASTKANDDQSIDGGNAVSSKMEFTEGGGYLALWLCLGLALAIVVVGTVYNIISDMCCHRTANHLRLSQLALNHNAEPFGTLEATCCDEVNCIDSRPQAE